jgi:hypothetical protein
MSADADEFAPSSRELKCDRRSAQTRQLLQQVPVLDPVLAGPQQRLEGIAAAIELLDEAAFASIAG